jgi:thioredoxin 1
MAVYSRLYIYVKSTILVFIKINKHFMNKFIIGGLIGVVALGLVYSVVASVNKSKMEEKAMMEEKMMMEKAEMEKKEIEDKAMMEKAEMEEKAMMEKEAMMKDGSDSMMKKETMADESMMKKDEEAAMMNKGSYEAYSASKIVLAEKGDVVLFFKASWCPTCRALDADIKANTTSIKDGLTILEVNYDVETSLKQKYGVTSQHTLVQVDKDGNLIAKWSGSPTLASLQMKVQ